MYTFWNQRHYTDLFFLQESNPHELINYLNSFITRKPFSHCKWKEKQTIIKASLAFLNYFSWMPFKILHPSAAIKNNGGGGERIVNKVVVFLFLTKTKKLVWAWQVNFYELSSWIAVSGLWENSCIITLGYRVSTICSVACFLVPSGKTRGPHSIKPCVTSQCKCPTHPATLQTQKYRWRKG